MAATKTATHSATTLATSTSAPIVQGLGTLLADTYALLLRTHQYHWNVTGAKFQALHTLFMAQYEEMFAAVDVLAERIRTFNAMSPGGIQELARLTQLGEKHATDADEMLRDLVEGNELVAKCARALSKMAGDAGDTSTQSMVDDRVLAHEKNAWMLRSSL